MSKTASAERGGLAGSLPSACLIGNRDYPYSCQGLRTIEEPVIRYEVSVLVGRRTFARQGCTSCVGGEVIHKNAADNLWMGFPRTHAGPAPSFGGSGISVRISLPDVTDLTGRCGSRSLGAPHHGPGPGGAPSFRGAMTMSPRQAPSSALLWLLDAKTPNSGEGGDMARSQSFVSELGYCGAIWKIILVPISRGGEQALEPRGIERPDFLVLPGDAIHSEAKCDRNRAKVGPSFAECVSK